MQDLKNPPSRLARNSIRHWGSLTTKHIYRVCLRTSWLAGQCKKWPPLFGCVTIYSGPFVPAATPHSIYISIIHSSVLDIFYDTTGGSPDTNIEEVKIIVEVGWNTCAFLSFQLDQQYQLAYQFPKLSAYYNEGQGRCPITFLPFGAWVSVSHRWGPSKESQTKHHYPFDQ